MIGAFLCAVAVSQATTLTFEDLGTNTGVVPSNYAGLTWINWVHYGQPLPPYNPSSGQVRLFPQNSPAVQFGQEVTFIGAWLAGNAFDQYFEGYKNGIKIFESAHTANDGSNFGQTFTLNWAGVDEIRLQQGSADQTALDDFQYEIGQTCTPPPPSLISWYPGEGNALDIIGSNNGTLRNGATFAPGMVGQTFSLDGVDDFVEVPDSADLTTSSLTIDTWVKRASSGNSGYPNIVSKYDSSVPAGVSWILFMYPTGQLAFVVYDSSSNYRYILTDAAVLEPDVWKHIAATFDAGTQAMLFYVDGVQVSSSLLSGSSVITSIADSSSAIRIGVAIDAYGQLSGLFAGLIDEVDIFGRALADSEIQAIFDAGSAGKCNVAADSPPTITAVPVTVECTSPTGTNATLVMHLYDADGDALTVSWDKDGQTAAVPAGAPDPTDADAQLTASFPKGTTNVMETVTDSANATASVATSVTVQDTTAPVITLNGANPLTVECHTSFTDPGATAVDACDGSRPVSVSGTVDANTLGSYTITYSATDLSGHTANMMRTVNVVDTAPPVINSVSASPNILTKPNHALRPVTVSVSATDACDANPVSTIISVTSNEADSGTGNGDRPNDIQITGALTVNLRAESSKLGTGRIYTITVRCQDASGNASTATTTVLVRK